MGLEKFTGLRDPNDKDGGGNTLLMVAIAMGKKELAKDLIKMGVTLDTQNKEGSTALMLSCIGSDVEITSLLIEHGANISLKDIFGHTAWDYAKLNKQNEQLKLLDTTLINRVM